MMWPLSLLQSDPVETRQQSFGDAISDYALAVASGEVHDASTTATIESCLGLYSRGLALARVQPDTIRTRGLTPALLAYVGRHMMRSGEAAFVLEVMDGVLRYIPCVIVYLNGDFDESTWEYRVALNGPTSVIHRTYPASRIVNAKYAVSASSPYRGLSPLQLASTSVSFHRNLEQRMREESTATSGYLIPTPTGRKEGSSEGDAVLDKIQARLRAIGGKTKLVQSMVQGWGEGAAHKVPSEYVQKRLGFDAPETAVRFREDLHEHILASYGVSEGLFKASGSGQAIRELWRVFVFASLAPVAKLAASAIGEKIGEPDLTLDLTETYAADVLSRSTSFKRLVESGMDAGKAAGVSGLMALEGDA